jgi:hypothetical protein
MRIRSMVFVPLATAFVAAAIACSGDPDGGETRSTFDEGDSGGLDASLPNTDPSDATPPPVRAPEPCDKPGALESVKCGKCGTTQRFCTSAALWEYGPCTDETGACRPGEFRESSCGNCGTQREVCTDSCGWSAIGACANEGLCKPGALVRSREGCATGQRDLRCSDACTFEPESECTVDRCENPGVTETVKCGNCGTRTRFCASSREWEYGPCSGEGGCAPGTSSQTACGNCGSQSRRCNDRCEWVNFGECTGSGECAPGATTRRTEGCPDGQARNFTCSNACRFEAQGSCQAATRGRLGELCVNGQCESPLVCDTSTGVGICRQPCVTDAACGAGACLGSSTPGPDGGTLRICSDTCTAFTSAGCPASTKCDFLGITAGLGSATKRMFVCSAIGPGRQGEPCTENRQCARDHVCGPSSDGGAARCRLICESNAGCPAAAPTCSKATSLFTTDTLGWCQ